MSCISAAQLKFWFQTDLGRENSASYYRQGRQLLLTLLTMITRWSRSSSNFYAVIGQNLTEFCVNLWCFNCLFPLDVQNEIQLLSGVFCYSWLVFSLGFWLRNTSFVKVVNPISDGIVFVFHLALQPRDKAVVLGVNTIEILLEKFTSKKRLVPREDICFCSWPTTWPPWRHVETSKGAMKAVEKVGPTFSSSVGDFGRLFLSV